MDGQIRRTSALGAREIKASAHYEYITSGITLDGGKFVAGELVLEGQCLVKDDVSGKYEKYADGVASPAVLTGTTNITAADLAGINAGTKLAFIVNGVSYEIANATLAALTAVGGAAAVLAAAKAAVDANGTKIDDICNLVNVANKLVIATDLAGGTISFHITAGVAGDVATVSGVFGIAQDAAAVGTSNFPAGKSNPVVLDESIKFKLTDAGANPDTTAGQILVHGTVYSGMCIGVTPAFKAALGGAIRFI